MCWWPSFGYAMWVTLKHLLPAKPSPLSPCARALTAVATLQSADIVLPIIDGREIRLRRVTSPTAEQRTLFQQLGVPLPESPVRSGM
jgi:hypothetical protein